MASTTCYIFSIMKMWISKLDGDNLMKNMEKRFELSGANIPIIEFFVAQCKNNLKLN